METLGFVFPGQGSQEAGMGADLVSVDPSYRRLLADASRLSGVDVTRALRVVADRTDAQQTVVTQLSVFALSVALGRRLLVGGIRPGFVAGHSLGEYSALVVGGWMDIDDALGLVARRACAMARCCAEHRGAMAAVVGLPHGALDEVVSGTGATVANLNSPKQVVVSGPRDAVGLACDRARSCGAAAVIDLPVAGAFHSPLMAGAEADLVEHIRDVRLVRGDIPLVSSITGRPVEDLSAYRVALAGQITAPVRWLEVMTSLDRIAEGRPDRIVEVGPGSVLRGLHRQFDRRRPVVTCGSRVECADLTPTGNATARLSG